MKIKSILIASAILFASNYAYSTTPDTVTKADFQRLEAKIDEMLKMMKTLIESTVQNIKDGVNNLHKQLADAGIRIVKNEKTGEQFGVIDKSKLPEGKITNNTTDGANGSNGMPQTERTPG